MADLSLSRAKTIITKVLDAAKDRDLAPLGICVLDAGGDIKAAQRQDGASNARVEVARGKASGALALGSGSRALKTRAESEPAFIAALAAATSIPDIVPAPGGVLLRSKSGEVIGAVGVSGDSSDNDEAVILEAISSIGSENLQADPG